MKKLLLLAVLSCLTACSSSGGSNQTQLSAQERSALVELQGVRLVYEVRSIMFRRFDDRKWGLC